MKLIGELKEINKKEKRDAYYKVLDFINSDRCYDGVVGVLYGLRTTGKTTIMHQLMVDNSDRFSCVFLEATSKDTMDDIYNALDEAVDNKVHCVFIDEITNVPDFIDNAYMLAEYYAKEGIRIVLSGHDSLCFIFAWNNSLYGKAEYISTTYIPFEEHIRVLGANDMNEYISYGGLMERGDETSGRLVYDYQSACRYIDEAVAGNIYRSLQCYARYANYNELFKITPNEMITVIEKMVEKYSGVLNTALKMNKSDITKEFVAVINADTRIVHKFDDDMIAWLENYLIRLGFVSAISNQEFVYGENMGWDSLPVYREYYLIQPVIKYHHLKKSLDFVEASEYYNNLSEADKQLFMDKLDFKIKEDMAKQIILYDTSKVLPRDRYFVHKVVFSNTVSDGESGKYDMMIYDKPGNSYYTFAIKYTTEPHHEQCRYLMNKKFKEIADRKYGKRENVCVLYNGKPFKNSSGVVYLNISDFVREITCCKDVKTTIENLCNDLSKLG